MKQDFSKMNDSCKLAKAYVALAFAQDVTKGYVKEQSSHEVLEPVLVMLDITAKLLEEVLDDVMLEEWDWTATEGMTTLEVVM